jgi:uncharacterized protein (DUF58 family)
MREGRYKLILSFGDSIDLNDGARYRIGERVELFDLENDLGEKRNLAAEMPRRAMQMRKKLEDWIRSCGAIVPGQNPRFDAERSLLESKQRS